MGFTHISKDGVQVIFVEASLRHRGVLLEAQRVLKHRSKLDTESGDIMHAHTQSHTFIHTCTHLQSLGFSFSLCRALPEPGAGWADGSPSINNKVLYYYFRGCIMFVSNNITSYWQVTSSTSFSKTEQTAPLFPQYSFFLLLAYFGKWQSVWNRPKHWRQWVRSPPACWQTPHSSFTPSSSPPEHWIQKASQRWNKFRAVTEKRSDVGITWFLGAFVGAVTAARDAEESEEKKETSTRELLELAFVCSNLASRGCKTLWAKLFDSWDRWPILFF